jgi:transposase
LSTKINALVDENGLPVRLMLAAGQAHNLRAAPHLLEGLKCRHVVADRGYDANALLDLIRASGAKAHIPQPASA